MYRTMVEASGKYTRYLDAADGHIDGLIKGIQEEITKRNQLSAEQRKQFQQKSNQAIRSLNLLWLKEMATTPAQLKEKMALFWHGHFATRNLNILYQQQYLDVLRRHALGSFRDLLHDVSKSAAMINFLNANQNRKDHPNENFAREVMELFTLGRGHYSENDVKEAARAFTGWGANLRGDFVFRRFQHDAGTKQVLGRSGRFSGDDVLNILLEERQTAQFITEKIYRHFVNTSIDAEKISWLSKRFYESDYNVGLLMENIFTSDWFYDEKNIGVQVKSPIELITGLRRTLPMEIENEQVFLLLQRLLGQMLFFPPNVAGWPGGMSWIDSSTLMLRMRLPQMLAQTDDLTMQPKSDDDQMMGRMDNNPLGMGRVGRAVQAHINWQPLLQAFDKTPRAALPEAIASRLLQTPLQVPAKIVFQDADDSSRQAWISSAAIRVFSTPEYQMC